MIQQPLTSEFFSQPTVAVAQQLLGHYLVVQHKAQSLLYHIVETEAYTQNDPACHAYKGNFGRGATLYKAPGLSYVYLIYGMYHCLNVVTEPEGQAGAVLFRGLEPITPVEDELKNTNGPGKLCKSLGITRAIHHEMIMTDPASLLCLYEGHPPKVSEIESSPRIGIRVATENLWRFYIKNNSYVSKAKP